MIEPPKLTDNKSILISNLMYSAYLAPLAVQVYKEKHFRAQPNKEDRNQGNDKNVKKSIVGTKL